MTQATVTTSSTTTAAVAVFTAVADVESATKRRKLTDQSDSNHHPLLPGLPDHIAQLCLSLVHPSTLYSVSRSWRRLIYSPSFPPFLSLYALFLPTDNTQTHPIQFLSFDPISSNWQTLPPPPQSPEQSLRPILRHPSFLSRNLPIQSVSVSGKLVLLAATADHLVPALPRPLVFNPISQKWRFGPPLGTPRRWCAAGAWGSTVFVASGIGSQFNLDVARSVEKWDLRNKENPGRNSRTSCRNGGISESGGNWEKLGPMRDGKFSRDAIDAVGWRGKLCMVNVKGNSAKEGVIYDVASDDWADMPEGMVAGWRGPAASMDGETLYAVDENKGVLRKYDAGRDKWEKVFGDERLRRAEQIAAAGGRVCVVCRGDGGGRIVVVDVVASPARSWAVDTPAGLQAWGVHVLPRMSRPD